MIDPGCDYHSVGVLDYQTAQGPALPLLLDVPHSGTIAPDDFTPAVPADVWQSIADPFVDDLVDGAVAYGATVLKALFPRSYIDVNRGLDDLSAEVIAGDWPFWPQNAQRQHRGAGLIRGFADWNTPMYHQPLPADLALRRVNDFYHPYHLLLAAALTGLQKSNGAVYHLNCHSMKSVGGQMNKDAGEVRADFVLSDRDGGSSDSQFAAWLAAALRQHGYRVAVNDPFKGAEILRRHGAPDDGVHSVQLEINRRLYMDEASGQKHAGFARLKAHLQAVIQAFSAAFSRWCLKGRIAPLWQH